jgi:hypothetical protein
MSIRRRLIAFVLTLVVGTLAALAATPVAIGQLMPASTVSVASVQQQCTCGHGMDAQCPMHHHGAESSKKSTSTSSNKWCAGCRDSVDMTLTAMIGFAAPMVERAAFTRPDAPSESLLASGAHPLDLVRPPTSPPPRG